MAGEERVAAGGASITVGRTPTSPPPPSPDRRPRRTPTTGDDEVKRPTNLFCARWADRLLTRAPRIWIRRQNCSRHPLPSSPAVQTPHRPPARPTLRRSLKGCTGAAPTPPTPHVGAAFPPASGMGIQGAPPEKATLKTRPMEDGPPPHETGLRGRGPPAAPSVGVLRVWSHAFASYPVSVSELLFPLGCWLGCWWLLTTSNPRTAETRTTPSPTRPKTKSYWDNNRGTADLQGISFRKFEVADLLFWRVVPKWDLFWR